MGFTRSYAVRAGGKASVAPLVDCVNVKRTPHVRDQILAGTFHRIPDPAGGGEWITVEKPFGYVDLDRRQYYLVRPRNERHTFRTANQQLMRMVSVLPAEYRERARFRLVFGLAELREKLLAQDAGIDDRTLELVKTFVIHQHPFLAQRARLRLTLQDHTAAGLLIHAAYDHSPRRFEVRVPGAMLSGIAKARDPLKKAFAKAHKNSIIDPKDTLKWVNISRWMPGHTILDALRAVVAALEKGKAPDPKAKEFRGMLAKLPRGSQLPPWAKQDLDSLFNWAVRKKDSKLQDTLFEIRYGRELEDDWALNDDPRDIDTLYKILRALPESNVDGNVALREIQLDEGGGGTYDPNTRDVAIGEDELPSKERFEDVFRHEIGHAVHEANQNKVDDWLRATFGWQMFDVARDADIDRWVALLGGYGSVSALEKAQIRGYIRAAVGKGSAWDPPAMALAPAGHPWNRADFNPRMALQRTGGNWFMNNSAWLLHQGSRFAANFWYATLMVVRDDTLAFVNSKMPDNYAAMSPLEFFAELYALYFDLDDPQRKNIPRVVAAWMEKNIGPAQPPAGGARKKTPSRASRTLDPSRSATGRKRLRP